MSLADVVEPLQQPLFTALDTRLQIVLITLAVYGRWTWTHGGGPGLDPLPAGVVGTAQARGRHRGAR